MNALKILQQKDYNAKRDLYQNVPQYAVPNSKFDDSTANGLTRCILTWLNLHGHYCTRIQSQGQYNQKLGRWTKSTVKRGIGDVMAIINGITVMIEIKVGKDRQSKYQKDTQIEVEHSGGTYLIARDFDSFYRWYGDFANRLMSAAKTTEKAGFESKGDLENIADNSENKEIEI